MAAVRVTYEISAEDVGEYTQMKSFLNQNPATTKVFDDVTYKAVITVDYPRSKDWS